MDDNLFNIWRNAWNDSVHATEHAQKRIKSAKSAKLTPVMVDTTDHYAYFQGSHGRYETWLDSCPCGDFIRYKLPCKHIYRLAMELGIIDEIVSNDKNLIPPVKAKKIDLSETIDIVEELSEDAQLLLLEIASSVSNNSPIYTAKVTNTLSELLNTPILKKASAEPIATILFGKKSEIIDLLNEYGVDFSAKDSKSHLSELCIANIYEQACEHFGVNISQDVLISPEYSYKNIHHYLHRKYGYISYYDGQNMIDLSLLESKLPNDKVTDELIKRGYYKK